MNTARSYLVRVCIAALLACTGCAVTRPATRPVWKHPGRPPSELATPAAFIITPAQAYDKVWASRRLSLKHVWHLYADATHYYVLDSFLGSSPVQARRKGVRVDGRTGRLEL